MADAELPSSQPPTAPRRQVTKTKDEQMLSDWFRMIPRSNEARALTRPRLKVFFQTSERLINLGNPAIIHQAIRDLASDGGLLRISELTQLDATQLQQTEQIQVMDTLFLPFLHTITHKDVLSSLMLEKSVGDIYVFLYGIAGRRAVALFTSLAAGLQSQLATSQFTALHSSTIAILTTSLQILECNQTASLQDNFRPILDLLQTCLDTEGTASFKGTLLGQAASQTMAKIRRYMNYGASLPPVQTPAISHLNQAATFELAIDGPGSLSSVGPRHNNDFTDICDIKILPTAQEIRSTRSEYLPLKDPSKWHIQGVKGLLDQQFRLLREDTVGQLRDCVRLVVEDLLRVGPRSPHEKEDYGLRVHKYSNVTFSGISYDKRKLLKVMATFDQPSFLTTKSARDRKLWWDQSKRLAVDTLVCLVDSDGRSLFFSISDQEGFKEKGFADGQPNDETDGQGNSSNTTTTPKTNLHRNPDVATISLRLIDIRDQDYSTVLTRDTTAPGPRQVLVEFPGVLLPSFQPTLEALQRMSRNIGDIPFSNILAPLADQLSAKTAWPAYATQPNFAFDFDPILRKDMKHGKSLRLAKNKTFNEDALRDRTTLDEAQCTALIGALSRDLALVQGPPGTGKSFVAVQAVKVLLNSREKAEMNPIICVCFTNHALDQFLEHLLADGIKQVIRIGARSKSQNLESLNLFNITRAMEETKSEKSEAWKLRTRLEKEGRELSTLFHKLKYAGTSDSILEHLEMEHPDHYDELTSSEDMDGFQLVQNRRSDPLTRWLWSQGSDTQYVRPNSELVEIPLQYMHRQDRFALYDSWKSAIHEQVLEELQGATERYIETDQQLLKCNQEIRLRCLREAHVIGLTTSGLAKNVQLLRRLKPKVVIFEEAGEILEAHTLTDFLPTVEHAILIGDHEQLRPQVQNYDLSLESFRGEKYSLDVSTFERLIMTPEIDVPHDTLETQRRMDPSISELIRRTIYPTLKDHESVLRYPAIAGFRHRLFWLDHREKEVSVDPLQVLQTSQSNDYEVELVRALATHLVRQGTYRGKNIVVLTPYVRQLQKLRDMLKESFDIVVEDRDEDELEKIDGGPPLVSDPRQTHRAVLTERLRIATVDNFQGEESDIVIVSLVRSNNDKRCGFLRTTNRINVLLSRAKHGMYIIGNSETYDQVPMWSQVIKLLKDSGRLGSSLPLRCSYHPDTPIEVTTPEDFLRKSPEGGCSEQCDQELHCGHPCTFKCHSAERHESVVCQTACERVHKGCGHTCTLHCGVECGRCLALVDVKLSCGHTINDVKCHESAITFTSAKCKLKTEVVVPGCGHMAMVLCGKTSLDPHFVCKAECGAELSCGHKCCNPCSICRDLKTGVTSHGKCTAQCGREYSTCSHQCEVECHGEDDCPPCQAQCQNHCSHTTCSKLCSEGCAPCSEPCKAGCVHQGFCKLPCAVPCNILPCPRRCEEVLACGHRCPSACGEPCPEWKYCQECANPNIKHTIVNFLEERTYEEIDLEDNPILIPECGHLIDTISMDICFEDAAQCDLNKHITRPTAVAVLLQIHCLPLCPVCRGSLQSIHRYNRIMKTALLAKSTEDVLDWASARSSPLAEALLLEEKLLSEDKIELSNGLVSNRENVDFNEVPSKIRIGGPRSLQLFSIRALSGVDTRLGPVLALHKGIDELSVLIRSEGAPFEKLREILEGLPFTELPFRGWVSTGCDIMEEQPFGYARIQLLLLRCEYDIVADIVRVYRAQTKNMAKKHPWLTKPLSLNFHFNRMECLKIAQYAKHHHLNTIEFNCRVLYVLFVALERVAPSPTTKIDQIIFDGMQELCIAKENIEASTDEVGQARIRELEGALADAECPILGFCAGG